MKKKKKDKETILWNRVFVNLTLLIETLHNIYKVQVRFEPRPLKNKLSKIDRKFHLHPS